MSEIKINLLGAAETASNTLLQRLQNLITQVRARAYDLSRNRTDDSRHDLEDWLQAEHEFLACQRCDVREQGNELIVEVDAEDFAPGDVKVTLLGNDLLIEGNSQSEKTEKNTLEKTGRSLFVRVFLSDQFNAATLKAELHAGVLRITAQSTKTEPTQSPSGGTAPAEGIQSEPGRQQAAAIA
jgi:HSP20 family molecular chaperone IbpA